MAPEIMRYNGEEEYNEKVDCFSFAMFLYELLTLKLPFEGQEQVKEFVLDGGRPQLTPSELLYPANMLDLMVVSWSATPTDRPTSSQLVSVTGAAEFGHLMDVVALADPGAAVLVGDAFVVDDEDDSEGGTPVSMAGGQNVGGLCSGVNLRGGSAAFAHLDADLWLSRSDGHVAVLASNEHGWTDYKSVFVNDDSFVTAVCLVEDTVWLGELTGLVRVYCARTCAELYSFSLSPHVLPDPSKSPRHQLSLPIADIKALAHCDLVAIGTCSPPCVLLCRMTDNLGGGGRPDPVVAAARVQHCRELHALAVLYCGVDVAQVWTGQSAGYMSVFQVHASDAPQPKLDHLASINHYEPVVEGVDVNRLTCSESDPTYMWSYVYPGSTLYQWSTENRQIVAKLDCSKIVPSSESISTINIEDRMNPGRCQVSSLALVERDWSPSAAASLLYIGTTWGVLVVAEADRLRPIAACRPHVEDVRVITPLDPKRRVGRWPTGAAGPGGWRKGLAGKGTGDSGSSSQCGLGAMSTSISQPVGPGPFVLTVGKGYRPLIQRWLDNYKEDPSVLESRNRDYFAIMWRADEWAV